MDTIIYQIRIGLEGIKPAVWRRLLVPSDVLVSDLHKIIQTAMGWTNSHLHQFVKDRTFYEPPAPEDVIFESSGTDYTGIKLNELLHKKNDKIIYEYDFGDGWEHEIRLEKIIEDDDSGLPVCTAGAMACPPGRLRRYLGIHGVQKNYEKPGASGIRRVC